MNSTNIWGKKAQTKQNNKKQCLFALNLPTLGVKEPVAATSSYFRLNSVGEGPMGLLCHNKSRHYIPKNLPH